MKTKILKSFSLVIFLGCFGKTNAQTELLSFNAVPATATAGIYTQDDKLIIGDFKRIIDNQNNVPVVTVKTEMSAVMQIRIFTLNGELEKEETLNLENGTNDLKVDMSDLSPGVYMVQFYTKNGSALRRFVKSN